MSKEKSVLLELLTKVDDLKKEIDKFHPLPVDVEERIMQKFRLDWNYNSNAIEGNTLNYGETFAFLMHGITAHGKPLKDYLDIKGHNQAINYLLNFVRNREELTEAVIRELHKTILVEPYEIDAVTSDGKPTKKTVTPGTYKTQPNHVKTATGEMHYFATPEETPAKMEELMNWYRKTREDKEVHPVVLAAFFHHQFVSIHPFDDGNGRMARLLMNLLLMQSNYPPVVIKTKDKNNYYLALSQADAGDSSPFVEYVANALIHSEEIYLKGAKGESIDEPDDLDKEITLIKKIFDGREDKIEKNDSPDERKFLLRHSFLPLIEEIFSVAYKFKEFFFEQSFSYMFFNEDRSAVGGEFQYITNSEYDSFVDTFLNQKNSSHITIYNKLDKYKAKKTFSLSIHVSVQFRTFHYILSTMLLETTGPDKVYDIGGQVVIGDWTKELLYGETPSNESIKEAGNVIGKEIIAHIKRSLNK